MRIEYYTDEGGIKIVNIFNEDGSQISMLKSIYDAQSTGHLTQVSTTSET